MSKVFKPVYLNIAIKRFYTVILSFLKRERERTVNVFGYSSQSVTLLRLESSWAFLTVFKTLRNGQEQ
jgi:hypothetical protein